MAANSSRKIFSAPSGLIVISCLGLAACSLPKITVQPRPSLQSPPSVSFAPAPAPAPVATLSLLNELRQHPDERVREIAALAYDVVQAQHEDLQKYEELDQRRAQQVTDLVDLVNAERTAFNSLLNAYQAAKRRGDKAVMAQIAIAIGTLVLTAVHH